MTDDLRGGPEFLSSKHRGVMIAVRLEAQLAGLLRQKHHEEIERALRGAVILDPLTNPRRWPVELRGANEEAAVEHARRIAAAGKAETP